MSSCCIGLACHEPEYGDPMCCQLAWHMSQWHVIVCAIVVANYGQVVCSCCIASEAVLTISRSHGGAQCKGTHCHKQQCWVGDTHCGCRACRQNQEHRVWWQVYVVARVRLLLCTSAQHVKIWEGGQEQQHTCLWQAAAQAEGGKRTCKAPSNAARGFLDCEPLMT